MIIKVVYGNKMGKKGIEDMIGVMVSEKKVGLIVLSF